MALTPHTQRAGMAEKHRQTLAQSADGTRREQVRLASAAAGWSTLSPAPNVRQHPAVAHSGHPSRSPGRPVVRHACAAPPPTTFPRRGHYRIGWSVGVPVLANNREHRRAADMPLPRFHPSGERQLPCSLQSIARGEKGLGRDALLSCFHPGFDHWWGAWLAAEAGIPQRVGYDVPSTKPFLTTAISYVPGRQEVVIIWRWWERGNGGWGMGNGDWKGCGLLFCSGIR